MSMFLIDNKKHTLQHLTKWCFIFSDIAKYLILSKTGVFVSEKRNPLIYINEISV